MVAEDFTIDFEPLPPDPGAISPEQVVVSYNRGTDTLFIHLFGHDRPAVALDVDEHTYLRIDPATHEIVGVQIEDFLSVVAVANPAWLGLAALGGVFEAETDAIQQQVQPQQLKEAALYSIRALLPASA